MLDHLNGRTRVFAIIGHPIGQVKSPAKMTRAFAARGFNGVLVPLDVEPSDFAQVVDALALCRNFDGIVVTVPHKFSSYKLCASATERANFLQAANTLRRAADGSWHGDMSDGLGFVAAMRRLGGNPQGKKALVIGAGGAGTAICHALIEAGLEKLAVHDHDGSRCDLLVDKLTKLELAEVVRGTPSPRGYDIVVNASPCGMGESDPMPVNVDELDGQMFVGDVITEPEKTPMLLAAERRGCPILTGVNMYDGLVDLMADYFVDNS